MQALGLVRTAEELVMQALGLVRILKNNFSEISFKKNAACKKMGLGRIVYSRVECLCSLI